jgi:hypothetical protein
MAKTKVLSFKERYHNAESKVDGVRTSFFGSLLSVNEPALGLQHTTSRLGQPNETRQGDHI